MVNDTFVVIASGPSLADDDVDHVVGKARVITVNDAYQIAPWADHHYAYDLVWWQRHKPVVDVECIGKLWSACDRVHSIFPDVRYIETRRGDVRLSKDYLVNGQNSGMHALCLAFVLGARRICLLGYDMQHTNGERHFFGKHPYGWGNADTVDKWIAGFNKIAPQFVAAGVEVVNCTRETALKCFPRLTIQEALP